MIITAGVELARARQRLDLPMEEFSRRTNIPVEWLNAIERSDANQMWDVDRLCDYLRVFASEVGLDPEDVSKRYIGQLRDWSPLNEFDSEDSGEGDSALGTSNQRGNTVVVTPPGPIAEQFSLSPAYTDTGDLAQQRRQPWSPRQLPYAAVLIVTLIALTTGFLAFAALPRRAGGSAAPGTGSIREASATPSAALSDTSQREEDGVATAGAVPEPTTAAPADLPLPGDRRSAPMNPATTLSGGSPVIVRGSTGSPRSLATTAGEAPPPAAPDKHTSHDLSASMPPAALNLSGWWMLTNRIEESRLDSFNELTLGFRLRLDHNGNRVRGEGFKWRENGRPVAPRARRPISVDGRMEGSRLTLTFTELGVRRTSRGSFEMQLADDGSLRGRFSSDAARSSGSTQAVRMPQPM